MKTNTKLFSPIILIVTALSGLARSVVLQNAIRCGERLGYDSHLGLHSGHKAMLQKAAAVVFFPSMAAWVPVAEQDIPLVQSLFKDTLPSDLPFRTFDVHQYGEFVTAIREAVEIEHIVGEHKLTLTPNGITISRHVPKTTPPASPAAGAN